MASRLTTLSRSSTSVKTVLITWWVLALLILMAPMAHAASAGTSVSVHLTVTDSLAVSLTGEPVNMDGLIQIGSPESGNVAFVALDD